MLEVGITNPAARFAEGNSRHQRIVVSLTDLNCYVRGSSERSLCCKPADHHRSHDRPTSKGPCPDGRHYWRRYGRLGFLNPPTDTTTNSKNPGGNTGVFSIQCRW
jgi:hypothetical protein